MNHMLLNILLLLPQDINVLFLLISFKCITVRCLGTLCSDKLMMALLGKLSAENYRNRDLRESPQASQTRPAFVFNRELLKFPHRGESSRQELSTRSSVIALKSDESYRQNFAARWCTVIPQFHQDIYTIHLKIMEVSFHKVQQFDCDFSGIFVLLRPLNATSFTLLRTSNKKNNRKIFHQQNGTCHNLVYNTQDNLEAFVRNIFFKLKVKSEEATQHTCMHVSTHTQSSKIKKQI